MYYNIQFYRLLTAFICDDSCPRETVDAVVEALLTIELPNFSALHVLQFLVAAAETHSHLYSRLRAWSISKLNENTNLTKLTVSYYYILTWKYYFEFVKANYNGLEKIPVLNYKQADDFVAAVFVLSVCSTERRDRTSQKSLRFLGK